MNAKKCIRRTVLITGATSGIGAKVAICFAEKGWDIICHYCSSKRKAVELSRAIERYGVKAHFVRADFLSEKQVYIFIKELERFAIDSLVNNAGTYVRRRHFSRLAYSDVSRVFMVNTFVPMILTSRIFMRMKERGFGRIVNISSIAAKYGGSAYSMHYGCSKLALEGLTKTLAREGAGHNVLVNTIRPGVIDTEFHKKFPKDMKRRIEMIPLKKIGRPEDIGDMVYYLGSDMNGYITNETVTVAGGE